MPVRVMVPAPPMEMLVAAVRSTIVAPRVLSLTVLMAMLPPLEPNDKSPGPPAIVQAPALKFSAPRSMPALTVTTPGFAVSGKKAAVGVSGSTLFDQATPGAGVVRSFQLRLVRSHEVGVVVSPPTHSKFTAAARAVDGDWSAQTPASAAAAAADRNARFR